MSEVSTGEAKTFMEAIVLAEFVVAKGLEHQGVSIDDNMTHAFVNFAEAVLSDDVPTFPTAWRAAALRADEVESTPQVRRMLQDASYSVALFMGIVRDDKSQPLVEIDHV